MALAEVAEGVLTLKVTGRSGEILIEVSGSSEVRSGEGTIGHLAPEFPRAAAALVGAKVQRAALERGKAITLSFGKGRALWISLAEGTYPGTRALFLKGPGKSYVSYHCDGATRLSR